MVNTKKITHERLGIWEKRMEESHATPVLLVGVGHDHVCGRLTLCTTTDRTNEEIIVLLTETIRQLRGGGVPVE
jgi:hypothetical protein